MLIDIYKDQDFNNFEEMFKVISKNLHSRGLVKETFYEAILQREKKYPTGLHGKARNIAIPHADPENVNESAYIVVMNKKPIKFHEMANEAKQLDVKIVIFILSDKPNGHMDLLKKTISLANVETKLDATKVKNILT